MYFDQSEYTIRCEWGPEGLNQLAPISDVLVIVDVISFTTSVDVAVSRGAWVYPYGWKDESLLAFASSVGAIPAIASRTRPGGAVTLALFAAAPAAWAEDCAGLPQWRDSFSGNRRDPHLCRLPAQRGCSRCRGCPGSCCQGRKPHQCDPGWRALERWNPSPGLRRPARRRSDPPAAARGVALS